MTSERNIRIGLLVVLAAFLASGCELARMELDPQLAGVPALPVKGSSGFLLKRHLQFGDWQTTTVKEGWTREVRRELGPARYELLDKRYRFSMMVASGPVDVQCEQLAEEASGRGPHGVIIGVDLAALRKTPPLQCWYYLDGVGVGALKLLRQGQMPLEHTGEIKFDDAFWTLNEVYRAEGARSWSIAPLAGFEIRRDGIAIAAVEKMNGGRVWIAPSLSQLEQDRAAAFITALLLFQPLEPAPDVT